MSIYTNLPLHFVQMSSWDSKKFLSENSQKYAIITAVALAIIGVAYAVYYFVKRYSAKPIDAPGPLPSPLPAPHNSPKPIPQPPKPQPQEPEPIKPKPKVIQTPPPSPPPSPQSPKLNPGGKPIDGGEKTEPDNKKKIDEAPHEADEEAELAWALQAIKDAEEREKAEALIKPAPQPAPEPTPVIPIQPAQAPLAYGPIAFKAPRLTERDSYPVFTRSEINAVFASYGTMFEKVNPRMAPPEGIVKNMIPLTYEHGFPNYPYLKQQTQKCLALILDVLRKDSDFSQAKKKATAQRLSDAFTDCQAVQCSTVATMGQELLSTGNLTESIRVYWQAYKMEKLDLQLIRGRHPNCETPDGQPQEQFPHIKNTYLVLLGDQFGLDGTKESANDKLRPANVLKGWESVKELANTYRDLLSLEEFIKQVAEDINSSNQDCSRIDKTLVFQWGKDNGMPSFGFYDENKNYSGLIPPTEEHKVFEGPCISLDETRELLRIIGISN